MSWKKVADVAAIVGKYQKDGQEKSKYMTCGVVLENENGHKCIKLTCLPFGEDGTIVNFLGVYPPKDSQEQAPSPGHRDDFNDDINF